MDAIPDEGRARQLLLAGEFDLLAPFAAQLINNADGVDEGVVECIALACASMGDLEKAVPLFAELMRRSPMSASHQINLAVLRLRMSDYRAARDLLVSVRPHTPHNAALEFNLALAHFALGEFSEATSILSDYVQNVPDDAVAVVYLARCLIELGDIESAELLMRDCSFDAVVEARDRFELSQVYIAIGEAERAQPILEEILCDDHGDVAARLSLASLFERSNKIEDARAQINQIPIAERDRPQWYVLDGKLAMAESRPAVALASFEQALRRAERDVGFAAERARAEIEFERAHCLDKLARFDDAFEGFVRANHLLREYFRVQRRGAPQRAIAGIEDSTELDAAVERARYSNRLGESPIFIVGFPRSGTTLLDQLLDAHPGLQVMEERPALDAVAAAVALASRQHLDALMTANTEQIDSWRALYWREVERYVRRVPGTRLVDKYPLNLARVQLAMCLFPDAQWVFALRHPCDVVLSCFMQSFRPTEATDGFWSLEQTAGVYREMIARWLTQRERLRPDCIDVRYEDLVADLHGTAQRLLTFLRLEWSDSVLRFSEHAKSRRINTPSYNQVVQPIYRRAVARWYNYRAYFGTTENILKPLIASLGYATSSENNETSSGK